MSEDRSARAVRLGLIEIKSQLDQLDPAWQYRAATQAESDALHATFVMADFESAFAFMTRVAQLAHELDHHPEWSNVYNRVQITLRTHDAGGVTGLDFEMAQRIDQLI